MNDYILIISPHTKVRLEEKPTEGVEGRVSKIVKVVLESYPNWEFSIMEPEDLKSAQDNKRVYFNGFSFIKIKNMRLGSYFLGLNPSYLLTLIRTLKKIKPKIILVSQPWGVFPTYLIAKKILKLDSFMLHDSHNVEAEYAKIIFKDSSIPVIIKVFYGITISLIEALALRYSDRTLAISRENKRKFVSKYAVSPEKIVVIPPSPSHIPEVPLGEKDGDSKIRAVFHGIYRTVQNREAIEIIRTKLVKQLSKYRNFEFVVFGKGVSPVEEEHFRSLGFVDNVYQVLAKCDIAVVPLVSGEGVKLKVLDYMAVGLPIVTTKKGAEGLELVNGKHAIIVDDVDEEFVKAIEYLIENPKVRRKLKYNAIKLAIKMASGDVYETLDIIPQSSLGTGRY